jgi:hypothetical protein
MFSKESLYTGKENGTKRSWSATGLESFNALMVNVYRDRHLHGHRFNRLFLEKMKQDYGRQRCSSQQENGNGAAQVIVAYSDLNVAFMVQQANLQDLAMVQEDESMWPPIEENELENPVICTAHAI